MEAETKASLLGEARRATLSDMSDPRLNGTMRTVYNWDFHGLAGQVKSLASRIENEQGSWSGMGRGVYDITSGLWYFEVAYSGEGAYDGLSALLFILDEDGGFTYHGMVFPGDLPEVPGLPEPTAE